MRPPDVAPVRWIRDPAPLHFTSCDGQRGSPFLDLQALNVNEERGLLTKRKGEREAGVDLSLAWSLPRYTHQGGLTLFGLVTSESLPHSLLCISISGNERQLRVCFTSCKDSSRLPFIPSSICVLGGFLPYSATTITTHHSLATTHRHTIASMSSLVENGSCSSSSKHGDSVAHLLQRRSPRQRIDPSRHPATEDWFG